MKRFSAVFVISLVIIALFATTANALSISGIKEWLSGTVVAYILTGILAIGVIGGSIMFSRIVTTLQELGEFLSALGLALSDKKMTKEELTDLLAKGKDVVNIWKKTPEQFKVN